MKHHLMYLAATAALFAPLAAHAQEVETDDDAVLLDRLVISAGRTPVEKDKTGVSNTVIDAEQIERSQTRYVADILRQVPGVSVSRTGSFGSLTQIRIRGGEASNVLVLIDGVEVSENSSGEFDFSSLQSYDIERIEVLRGPQSAFYGSDALAGVISIVTKGGRRNSTEAGYNIEYGTDETRLIGGYVRGGTDTFDGSLSISQRITNGFNVSDLGSESDGDDNLTLNGKFSLDLAEGLVLDGTGRYVNRDSDFDNQPFMSVVVDSDNANATEELFGSIGLTYDSPDDVWTHKARFTASDITRETFANGVLSSGNAEDRQKALYQITHRMDLGKRYKQTLTGGYEWERETFRGLVAPFDPSQLEEKARETHSLVAEYRGEFNEQFFLNAAVRHDFNDAFQDATTYSVSAAYLFPDTDTRLHASVGTGQVAPTFFEQFGFIPANFIGNPDLNPETSFGWDIGVEQKFFDGGLVVDVTYFNQNLENEIFTDFSVFPFTVDNGTGTSERQGVEVSVNAYLDYGFSVSGSYTYLDATNPDGSIETRRPRHSGSARIDYVNPEDGHTLFAEAVFNGTMDDLSFTTFPATPVELDSYTVVNIGGSFKFNENFELYARIENLFDEEYEEIADYNTQGREAFIGIRGKF